MGVPVIVAALSISVIVCFGFLSHHGLHFQ
jgi:hypothetical protein